MKKLKLQALEISATGLLTREQLRHIVGGSAGGHCNTVADCGTGGYSYVCVNSICVVTTFGNGCVPRCTQSNQYCSGSGQCLTY